MSAAPGDFLRRWSRRKLAARHDAATSAPTAAPALPAIESIGPDSDVAAFMHAKVDEAVRRAALRKLFSDPRFNVMDGLDIYIGDYTAGDPIPAAMLAGLDHARATLALAGPEKAVEEPAEPPGERNAAA